MVETFEPLLRRHGVVIERIVSHGDTTPADRPWVQPHDEWVMLVAGSARVLIEGEHEHALEPGEHLLIRAGARHWVTHTAVDEPTVWLGVHLPEG